MLYLARFGFGTSKAFGNHSTKESESLVLHAVETLRRHGLLNQIAAWGSPEI